MSMANYCDLEFVAVFKLYSLFICACVLASVRESACACIFACATLLFFLVCTNQNSIFCNGM